MRAIFVHGAGGGGWQWQIWARVLATHGLTPVLLTLKQRKDVGSTRLADYRDQLQALIVGAYSNCVVIGASMGGALALDVPGGDQLAARIAINPPLDTNILSQKYSQKSGIKPWSKGLTRSTWQSLQSDFFSRQYAHARWRDESNAVLYDLAHWQLDSRPDQPSLILHGANDSGCPMNAVQDLQMRFFCDALLVPEAGHLEPVLGAQALVCARRVAGWIDARISARVGASIS